MAEKIYPPQVDFPHKDKDVTVRYLIQAYHAAAGKERSLFREKILGLPASRLKILATKIYGSVTMEGCGIVTREDMYKLVVWYVLEVSGGLNEEQLDVLRRHRSALIGEAQSVYEPTNDEKESEMETTSAKAVETEKSKGKKTSPSKRVGNSEKKVVTAKKTAASKETKKKEVVKYQLIPGLKFDNLKGFSDGTTLRAVAEMFSKPTTSAEVAEEVYKLREKLFSRSKKDPKVHAKAWASYALSKLKNQKAVKPAA